MSASKKSKLHWVQAPSAKPINSFRNRRAGGRDGFILHLQAATRHRFRLS